MNRLQIITGFMGFILTITPLSAMELDGGEAAFNSSIDKLFTAGDESAPVKILLYGCCRCPVCARLVPELYGEVTTGRLKSKAYLVLHLILKSERPGSVEGGTAALAASQQNMLWPFLLRMFHNQDSRPGGLETKTAMETGLDMDAYAIARDDPKLKKLVIELLEESKDIKRTPLVYINGKKYENIKSTSEIVEKADEAYRGIREK